MSYNVTSTVTLRSTLTITKADALILKRKHKAILPEDHFLEGLRFSKAHCTEGHEVFGPFCSQCGEQVKEGEPIPIKDFRWSGMCSGYLGNLAIAASYTKGEADVVLVWEGGDSVSALKIKDGVVTDHEVSYAIGKANYTLVPETDGDGRGSP